MRGRGGVRERGIERGRRGGRESESGGVREGERGGGRRERKQLAVFKSD